MIATLPDATHIPAKEWQSQAACTNYPADLFFPNDYDSPQSRMQVRIARSVCAACPVLAACLVAAVEQEGARHAKHRHGIWGGTTPSERYYYHRRQATAERQQDAA